MQNRTWKLLIAGGDSEGKELKELAKSLNVLERIEFLGKVKDIWSVYNRCKIFIMPSRSEGFPNALCEAMISGMACISFDFIAGPSDLIIDGQNGLLVKEGDVSLLAQKIDMLIEDEELIKRLGSQAFQLRNKLDENFIGEKVQNFIFNR
jgi:glycosyltransferase involved in cell wall biosynthesis